MKYTFDTVPESLFSYLSKAKDLRNVCVTFAESAVHHVEKLLLPLLISDAGVVDLTISVTHIVQKVLA